MHFLCLHGLGTNSQIFELQTAAIRYALGPDHTYDFIEGELSYPMEPGISHLVSPGDSFHAYFDPTKASSILSTLAELEDHIAAEDDPPYDAVMGFSHGSCLAATLLLRNSTGSSPAPFKLAVFLSAGMALDNAALEHGEVRMFNRTGLKIGIPTAHVWGENDASAPGQGKLLSELCEPGKRATAVHMGGHSVPGVKEKRDLDAAVKAIKRAIEKAQEGDF